jgi:hypothetical protein
MEPTMEAGTENASGAKPVLVPVVKIDEGRIEAHWPRWSGQRWKRR